MGKKNKTSSSRIVQTTHKSSPSQKKQNTQNSQYVNNPNTVATNQARVNLFVNQHSIFNMSLKCLVGLTLCLVARLVYTNSKFTDSDRISLAREPLTNKTILSTESTTIDLSSNTITQSIRPSFELLPTVFIGILVRNKAHSLPYFLHGLEIQDYPTERVHISFIVDNSIDDSQFILATWIEAVQTRYHGVEIEIGTNALERSKMWTDEHQVHFLQLRQKMLDSARSSWADFYLSIDADVILVNPETIRRLVAVSHNPGTSELPPLLPVLAPLLNCTNSEYYSNFWGDMTEQGYYKRSHDYFDIQKRIKSGIFPVAMVHTMFIVNLHHFLSPHLQYYPPSEGYSGPMDDLILLAKSAQASGIQYYLDNTQFYGYIAAPVEESDVEEIGSSIEDWLAREQELFTHLRLQAVVDNEEYAPILPSPHLAQIAEAHLPTRSKLGFDEIYYINLLRRPDRRVKTEYFLDQLGVAAQHVTAVDGKELDAQQLKDMGIQQLKGYADPYHKRSLKFGEIGCFLSHYNLWKEMIERGYQRILILEDDVRFAPGFVRNLADVLREADQSRPDWDLLYIGRKRMSKKETRVPGTSKLAYPDYTYWTLGYILKRSGAEKLLAQDPLKKMVAVDEYLPIMFNRHPQKDWVQQFEPRNLIALSAEPLLLEPQKYTGEKLYVSDTEDSAILGTF